MFNTRQSAFYTKNRTEYIMVSINAPEKQFEVNFSIADSVLFSHYVEKDYNFLQSVRFSLYNL